MMFNPTPKPNHKRRVPTQKQRNEFSRKVRKQIMDDQESKCQSCGGKATQVHHVYPRGRGGRGVYSNGMAICNGCHTRIHKDNTLLNYWIYLYQKNHGQNFYKDEWDL